MGVSGIKSQYQHSCIPFWRLWQGKAGTPGSAFWPFRASRGYPHSLARGPLHLQSQYWPVSLLTLHHSSPPPPLPSSLTSDPCDYTGPNWMIQDSISQSAHSQLICSLNSPLLCSMTYSQVLGLRDAIILPIAVLDNLETWENLRTVRTSLEENVQAKKFWHVISWAPKHEPWL